MAYGKPKSKARGQALRKTQSQMTKASESGRAAGQLAGLYTQAPVKEPSAPKGTGKARER